MKSKKKLIRRLKFYSTILVLSTVYLVDSGLNDKIVIQ